MPDPDVGGDEGRRAIEVDATVIEALPNAMYRVTLQNESRDRATVHVSGGAGLLRVLPGDDVVVELMPYDTGRGRIVRRRS